MLTDALLPSALAPPLQVRLRQKLSLNAVKSFFTGKEEKDPAVAKLEELKVRECVCVRMCVCIRGVGQGQLFE